MHVDCLDALAIHRDGQSLAARLLRPRTIEYRASAKGDPGRASRNLQKMSSGGHFPSWSILICSREYRGSGKTGSSGIFAALLAEVSKTGALVNGALAYLNGRLLVDNGVWIEPGALSLQLLGPLSAQLGHSGLSRLERPFMPRQPTFEAAQTSDRLGAERRIGFPPIGWRRAKRPLVGSENGPLLLLIRAT
jgi:hypothetical protein